MSTGSLENQVARIHILLRNKAWKIATAESMTAGSVSAALARVAGASNVLLGGMACYLPEMKALLGISALDLSSEGAESMATSEALARGLAAMLPEADVVLGITGSASPSRPDYQTTAEAGCVFICIGIQDVYQAFETQLSGDRTEVLDAAVVFALDCLEHSLLARS
jgi:PncC family amidohydrolase